MPFLCTWQGGCGVGCSMCWGVAEGLGGVCRHQGGRSQLGGHRRVSQSVTRSCVSSPRNHRLKGWDSMETGKQLNHRDAQHRLPPSRQD